MPSSEEARKYLDEALKELGVTMAEASDEGGMNHAYIQQYIGRGKPTKLPEAVRDAIVRRWPKIDPERLKVPPRPSPAGRQRKRPSRNGHNEAQINPPRDGKFVDDPRTLELLSVWGDIRDPQQRALALKILRAMTADRSAEVA